MDQELSARIEQAKQELEQMIDLNPQVMLLVDRQGIIQRANTALLALMGLTGFRSVLGRRIGDLFPGTEDIGRIGHITTESATREIEMKIPGRGNRALRFVVVGGVRSNELSVVIVNDVTDEKLRAAGLEEKYKREAVDALAGALMHNVNQSLTVIMAETHLLQLALQAGSPDPAEVGDSLGGILSHTTRIAEILKKVQSAKRFVTEPYAGDTVIMDIERSSSDQPDVLPEAGETLQPADPVDREVVETLMAALDTHEASACDHARRTGEYAAILAGHMGLGDAVVRSVRQCARFHDIGKIGVPDRILQKPDRLTDTEMEIMKRHSLIGYGLLRAVPGMHVEAQAARFHHERYDGRGYPDGLSGDEIPLVSRIISVADAFDVMRSGRPYAAAKPLDLTARILIDEAGGQFDPEVIEVFRKCYEEMNARFAERSG